MLALLPTLLFIRIGIALADRVSHVLFTRPLIVMFVIMELKLLVDVAASF